MADPQRKRSWLVPLVVAAAAMLQASLAAAHASAKEAPLNSGRSSSTYEGLAPPPQNVLDAVLEAERRTGIDPALLLMIAWTESRFRSDAKNQTSSAAGLLQFTQQTWLENIKAFGGTLGLNHFAALIHRSDDGNLAVHPSATRKVLDLRHDPRTATMLAAERLDHQRELSLETDRPLRVVDLYLIHALGVKGATRFLEGVAKRPSARCMDVVGNVAWKQSGLFGDMPDGRSTSAIAAYQVISARLEQRRSYYVNFLEYAAAVSERRRWVREQIAKTYPFLNGILPADRGSPLAALRFWLVQLERPVPSE